MTSLFDKSRELIKESTSYKKTDILKAIELIEQAIQICPETVLSDKFKLSGYYHLSGNTEKAYSILFCMLSDMEVNSTYTMRNMDKLQVYEKICTLCFSDKRYLDYIFYYSLQRYNANLAIFTQGRQEDYERCKDSFDSFGLSYSTKIKTCFKNLKKDDKAKIFDEKFSTFINLHLNELLFIMKKSHSALWSNDYNMTRNESVGERADRILKADKEFLNSCSKYSDTYFIAFYNQTLEPLIL